MPSLFGAHSGGGDDSGVTAGGGSAAADAKSKDAANCRTCTDFKSWARVQRGALEVKRDVNAPEGVRQASTLANVSAGNVNSSNNKVSAPTTTASSPPTSSLSTTSDDNRRPDCPYDKDDLGRSTWGLLHTIAAHYPEQPSNTEIREMSSFFTILSKFYPCEICAKDFRKELTVEPVNATSQTALSQWLCRFHNKVNLKIGKPVFDCALVNQRWRDGWIDGSCD